MAPVGAGSLGSGGGGASSSSRPSRTSVSQVSSSFLTGNCAVCNVCNSYYGPAFSQPVCATCHAFLYANDLDQEINLQIMSAEEMDPDEDREATHLAEFLDPFGSLLDHFDPFGPSFRSFGTLFDAYFSPILTLFGCFSILLKQLRTGNPFQFHSQAIFWAYL